MSGESLRVELDGPVATVWMCRPRVHNAFEPGLIAGLGETFEELAATDGVRAVVLAGEGRSFSAGADLRWMRETAGYGAEENLEDARRLARMFRTIEACPRPVIARVHGAALGGGMGLVAVCDIALAARGARFGFTEARLGLAPAIIAPFVLDKLGPGAARELFLTARRFDAGEAQRLGLVHRVAEEGQLDRELRRVLADLLACGPDALSACKELLLSLRRLPREAVDEQTCRLIARLRSGEEGQAGMGAFLSGERPPWLREPPSPRVSC